MMLSSEYGASLFKKIVQFRLSAQEGLDLLKMVAAVV